MDRSIKMMKRILLITAMLFFAAAILPVNDGSERWFKNSGLRQEVYAADAKEVYVAGHNDHYDPRTGYGYYNHGYTCLKSDQSIHDTNGSAGAGTAGYKNGVLTLDGYKFNGDGAYSDGASSYCIYAKGDLEICVKGNNQLVNDALCKGNTSIKKLYGIYVTGNLTITNDPSSDGVLNISTGGLPEESTCGIYCKTLTIKNSGTGTISVSSEPGPVKHASKDKESQSYGTFIFQGGEGLNVKSGSFTSKGSYFANNSDSNCTSYGLYLRHDLNVSGGKVTLDASKAEKCAGLFYNYDWDQHYYLNITGGEIEAGSRNVRYGIEFDRNEKGHLKLESGKLTVTGYQWAIYTSYQDIYDDIKAPIMKGYESYGGSLKESKTYNGRWSHAILDGNRLKVTMRDWTYGDVPQSPSWTPRHEGDKEIITYKGRKGTNYESTVCPNDIGDYTVTVSYRDGLQTGSADFSIKKRNLSDAKVKLELLPSFQMDYNGESQEAVYTLQIKGNDLNKGTDYTVTGDRATDVGDNTITFSGIGNYTGTISGTWSLKKASPYEYLIITEPSDRVYTGNPTEPVKAPVLKENYSGLGTITVYYKSSSDTSYPRSTVPPTEVGKYDVTFDVGAGKNFAAVANQRITKAGEPLEITKLTTSDIYLNSGGQKGKDTYLDLSDYIGVEGELDDPRVVEHGELLDGGFILEPDKETVKFKFNEGCAEGSVANVSVKVIECKNYNPYYIRLALTSVRAHDHSSLKHVDRVTAKCDKDGNRGYYECEICDRFFRDKEGTWPFIDKDDVILRATGHNWSDFKVTQEPGCDTKGEESCKCSVCGEVKRRDIDALGHDLGDWVITKRPTLTEKGEKTRRCSRCDYSETEEIPKTGEDSPSGNQIDRVPLIGDESYPSSNDNFAPVSFSGKIKQLGLDFSNVSKSKVKPDALTMTVIKGSKLTTVSRIAEGGSASGSGGVKVIVNKKTRIATVSCKDSGSATLPMEDGVTYTVTFTVDKPKPVKAMKSMPTGEETVNRTIKELFDTDIDSGELFAQSKRGASGVTVSNNSLVIKPQEKDTIKVQYQYLNKRYKLSIKVK